MNNTMICDKEREAVEQVFKAIENLVEQHDGSITFESIKNASKVEIVHTLFYMRMLKDLLHDADAIRSMFHIEEDQFIEIVTEGGKKSLDNVEKNMLIDMMMETFPRS